MLKLVIDTNLWLRTLMGGPNSAFLLQSWQLRQYVPVISDDLLAELQEVSRRPRLQSRIHQEDVALLVSELRQFGLFVAPVTVLPMCRDPKDHPVLAAAIDGHADAIVSGDADLRVTAISVRKWRNMVWLCGELKHCVPGLQPKRWNKCIL